MRDAQLEAIEELVDVERAVVRLTDRQREVLALTVAGWTQEEIGEELGIAQWTVSRELTAVRETLETMHKTPIETGSRSRRGSHG